MKKNLKYKSVRESAPSKASFSITSILLFLKSLLFERVSFSIYLKFRILKLSIKTHILWIDFNRLNNLFAFISLMSLSCKCLQFKKLWSSKLKMYNQVSLSYNSVVYSGIFLGISCKFWPRQSTTVPWQTQSFGHSLVAPQKSSKKSLSKLDVKLHLNLTLGIEPMLFLASRFGILQVIPDFSTGLVRKNSFSHFNLQSHTRGFLPKCLFVYFIYFLRLKSIQ